jgi:hypothetical protein
VAAGNLPIQVDLVMYAATTFHREFRWLPDGVIAQDFTGWSAVMLIGPLRGAALYELSSSGGGLTLSGDGLVTVTLPASATEALATVENLAYQLDLSEPTEPDATVTRFLRGRCSVVRDVDPPT